MPCDIQESTPKLGDLKKLYTAYLNAIDGKFVDRSGKLALIRSEAKNCDYIKTLVYTWQISTITTWRR